MYSLNPDRTKNLFCLFYSLTCAVRVELLAASVFTLVHHSHGSVAFNFIICQSFNTTMFIKACPHIRCWQSGTQFVHCVLTVLRLSATAQVDVALQQWHLSNRGGRGHPEMLPFKWKMRFHPFSAPRCWHVCVNHFYYVPTFTPASTTSLTGIRPSLLPTCQSSLPFQILPFKAYKQSVNSLSLTSNTRR